MKIFRVVVLVLTIVHLLPVGFTAAVGGFADGGNLWERLALMLVHPVTAILLLLMAALPTPSRRLLMLGSAVIVVNVIADVSLSLAISSGNIRGDWWLPLVFSVVPLIGLAYTLTLLTRRAD